MYNATQGLFVTALDARGLVWTAISDFEVMLTSGGVTGVNRC